MSQKLKKRISEILEVATPGDQLSRIFDIFIITLISLNIIAVILETVESLSSKYMPFFRNFEIFSVVIFTIEYISRIWSCTVNAKFKNPVLGRIRFALTPLLIVDLLAILPFYLRMIIPMIIPFDLRFLRAFRLMRILRMFKIGRYSESLRMFGRVLKAKKEELLIAVFMILILLIISSSLMYFVENEAQPQTFSSIPDAMWWGVTTLTTVGYGDVYPVTPVGKFLGAIIAILGIGIFALPTGILASGFVEEIQKRRTKRIICPHCGKDINEPPETSSNSRCPKSRTPL